MYRLLTLGLLIAAVHGAVISNEVTETPRIHTSEQLISAIVNDCFEINGMSCLKGKVLTYLDTVLGLKAEQARAFDENNVDKVIYDRVSRVLATNEIRCELPKTIFGDVAVTYRADRGLDFDMSEEKQAARGIIKKKLLFPVLLLLKLKMKALMPIFVALIGLKAMKALILSKLAITIVLGFLVAQLVKKTGLGMPMSMMPMMPGAQEPPMAYGPPTTPATPDTSYGPAAWEPSSAGSSYSRVWEPSAASSSHNLAYSSYYPSNSYSGSSSSSAVSAGTSSSSSQTATATAY